jgi:hypothetical protein
VGTPETTTTGTEQGVREWWRTLAVVVLGQLGVGVGTVKGRGKGRGPWLEPWKDCVVSTAYGAEGLVSKWDDWPRTGKEPGQG